MHYKRLQGLFTLENPGCILTMCSLLRGFILSPLLPGNVRGFMGNQSACKAELLSPCYNWSVKNPTALENLLSQDSSQPLCWAFPFQHQITFEHMDSISCICCFGGNLAFSRKKFHAEMCLKSVACDQQSTHEAGFACPPSSCWTHRSCLI